MFQNLLKELSNICLYSYFSLTKEHPYPLSILPRKKFIVKIDLEGLSSDNNEYYLVRRSNNGADDTWNADTGILREDAILVEDIPCLSLNILGAKFKVPHIKFQPKGEASKPWKGESINFYTYKDSYKVDTVGSPIYFKLKDLHNRTFPYERVKDSGIKGFIAQLKLAINSNGKYPFQGSTKVIHTPNNLNYWHIELFLFDHGEKLIKDAEAAWKKDAAMAFGHMMSGSAKRGIEKSIIPISEDNFLTRKVK